ncbi:ricin-type beta-trefoil lectin domain protein [Kitasatospora sp. NPDC006697]|uniref:ricin-type beta-trefoil lectin domain protein n=1 Tax=Kitasatospora sp. NPDC006697 TaxID=3364020 RepID=UPI0036A1BF78
MGETRLPRLGRDSSATHHPLPLAFTDRSGRLARLTHRLVLGTAVTGLLLGGAGLATAAPQTAASATSAAAVPGDIDGDGIQDLVLPDPSGNGNLIALTAGTAYAPQRVLSTAAQSPEHDSWRDYRIAHFGSLTGTGPDDLFALNVVSHQLYLYRNDAATGGTAGQFTNAAGITKLARPACNTAGLRCSFYKADWTDVDQIVAGPDHNGGTSPALYDVENGSIFSFSWSGSGLTNGVNLGAFYGTTLLSATVAGAPTLWARDDTTGALFTKQLSFTQAGLPTGDFTGAQTFLDSNLREPGTGAWMGAAPADSTTGSQVQFLPPNTNQWVFGTDGTVRAFGKCLDATGNGTANGTKLEVWDCNGGANQQWTVGAHGILVNPVSGRCVDNPYGANVSGTQLQLWDCNGGTNQQWTAGGALSPILPVSAIAETAASLFAPGDTTNGNPNLYALSPDGVLTEYPGASAVSGIAQFGAPQTIGLVRPGHVRIQSADVSGKCVDSPWGNTAIGTATNLFSCNGGSNQVWTLATDLTVRMGSHCVGFDPNALTQPIFLDRCSRGRIQWWATNPNGSLQVSSGYGCLTDPNGSAVDPTQLQLAACTGAPGQKWTLVTAA